MEKNLRIKLIKIALPIFVLMLIAMVVYNKNYSASALLELADKYYSGNGVVRNQDLAFEYYRKAAARGNAEAQYAMGIIYFRNGDRQEGARWYKKAAENGHTQAQNIMNGLIKSGFQFASDESINCNRDIINCIKKSPDEAFNRYIYPTALNDFLKNQKTFLETSKKTSFPKIGLIQMGQTHKEYAKIMIDTGYTCQSFQYIGRKLDDLDSIEQKSFLDNFHKSYQGYSSLGHDTCKSPKKLIEVSFTKIGTIYKVREQISENEFLELLSQIGYTKKEIDEAKEREHFGMPAFEIGLIKKGDFSWRYWKSGENERTVVIEDTPYQNAADTYFDKMSEADTYDDLGEEDK